MAEFIRKPYQVIDLTNEQIMELARLMKRPTGIKRMIHYVEINTADGPINFGKVIKDFQWDMIDLLQDNDRSILLASRQMSKCVTVDTKIEIKNEITKQIEKITIGQFHDKTNHK